MPKLFRRSWERLRRGKRGAISAVKTARTGSNGSFAGTTAAPSSTFTAVGANFVAGDIGRYIRLMGTASQQKFDGVYIIDSITDSDNVILRYNHNVPSTPASLAVFSENSSSISYKICESATLTVSGDDDLIEDFMTGCNMTIEIAANSANKGTWRISHRTSSTVCIISKSHVFYVADYSSANTQNTFYIDHGNDFVAETDMQWFIHDRQAFNAFDQCELVLQALIDMGWSVYQVRGPSNTLQCHRDMILRSLGEDNTGISGGKAMFLRYTYWGTGRAGTAPLHTFTGSYCDMSLWHHWDRTQTATSPGNGVGGTVFSPSTQYQVPASTVMSTSSSGWVFGSDIEDPENGSGRGGLPAGQLWLNWSVFGDRDEFHAFWNREALASGWGHASCSHLRTAGGTNNNIVQVTAPFTAGANKDMNVGTVDVTALSPPYAIGDNVSIIGRKTTATAEYIFTSSITAFNNTDVNNRLVRIANADTAMGNGPDTLKVQFGEDPFPIVVEANTGTTFTPRLHNLSRLANATGRDHNATTFGSAGADFNAISSFLEIDPSRRSGKWGLVAVYLKHVASAEIRGRYRYYFRAPPAKFPLYKKLVFQDGSVYVFASQLDTTQGVWVGPMSKTQAGVV